MNYITLTSTPLGYIFDNIFNKYKIPLELRIMIFEYLNTRDIRYFGNLNICVELDCLFNKKTLDKHYERELILNDKVNLVKTQINSLCFTCTTSEEETLLISLTRKYNTYRTQELINKQFSDTREKFYTKLNKSENNPKYYRGQTRVPGYTRGISKYYECVKCFDNSEQIITDRNRHIRCMYLKLEYNKKPIKMYRYLKKDLQKILENNNVKYYKS